MNEIMITTKKRTWALQNQANNSLKSLEDQSSQIWSPLYSQVHHDQFRWQLPSPDSVLPLGIWTTTPIMPSLSDRVDVFDESTRSPHPLEDSSEMLAIPFQCDN